MKAIAGIVGGFIFATIGMVLIGSLFAASSGNGGSYSAFAPPALWIIGILVAVRSKSAAKAWRKLLIASGLLSFLLPISVLVFKSNFTTTLAGAPASSTAISGGTISGTIGITGLFLGVVFLVIGFLVGRDKQVDFIWQIPSSSIDRR